jgi:hypothetical protein
MLKDDQAAELLRRCESITNLKLNQVRGNLRNAESIAAAVWELLVLEEVSKIGKVEYEPHQGSSPDILLYFNNERKIWIEVAFLYPRFWKQERQSDVVADWIFKEALRLDIPPCKVSCQFNGDRKNISGFVRKLPDLNEKKTFLKNFEIKKFFDSIKNNPLKRFSIRHSVYTIELIYSPEIESEFLHTGGLVQEVPKTIKEHAVYRVLKEKARQHKKIDGARLIFIGSDQSPALSSSRISVRDSVYAAFNETKSLSGAIVLKIEDSIINGYKRYAKYEIFNNHKAYDPLFEEEINQLSYMNFNRWNYFFSLGKFEKDNKDFFRKISGSMKLKISDKSVKLEFPSNLLMDFLIGKTNLIKEYDIHENHHIVKYLKENWVVKFCSWKKGNIELGEADKIVLELEPPKESVYWPNRRMKIDNEKL